MSPRHGPRRADVVLDEVAREQLRKMSVAETLAADRAVVAISVNPWLGEPIEGSPFREYRDDTGVRVVYVTTALGTIIIVAYLEA